MLPKAETPWVHKATCMRAEEDWVGPAVFNIWHEPCERVGVCTHPHKPFRDNADLQVWVRYWALTAKLCDASDLPQACDSAEDEAEDDASSDNADAVASDQPLASQTSGEISKKDTDDAVEAEEEPGCTHQPTYTRTSLKQLVACDKTFFAHVVRDDRPDVYILQSAFMASQYGQRLIQAILSEDISQPFLGSYAHSLVTLCSCKDAMSVLHKYARTNPSLIISMIEHIVEHIELDAKAIRRALTVGPQHQCCVADYEARRSGTIHLLYDVRYMVHKLTGVRMTTKLRLFNAVLRACGKESMTPEQVTRAQAADPSCMIISPYVDDELLFALAEELIEAEQARPSYVATHEATCRRVCYCRPCSSCGQKGAKLRCARCDVSDFCHKDCFRQHWKQHKMWCTPCKFSEEPGFRPHKYALDGDKVVVIDDEVQSVASATVE